MYVYYEIYNNKMQKLVTSTLFPRLASLVFLKCDRTCKRILKTIASTQRDIDPIPCAPFLPWCGLGGGSARLGMRLAILALARIPFISPAQCCLSPAAHHHNQAGGFYTVPFLITCGQATQ